MQIEELYTKELIPYSNNPRNNESAVDAVAASIKEFGFKVPIIIDKDNVIVAGHTRLKAALKIGLEKVPCIKADDLTPEQLKAFRLADNKVGELATWDFDKLEEELTELDALDLDFTMSDFGFDVSENRGGGSENVIEDDYDAEPPEEPKAKPGDVYALGDHRLICGDSTDIKVVERLMNGERAETVFTDPPYNMHYDGAGIIRETITNVRERIKDIVDFDAFSISYLPTLNVGSAFIFTSKDLIPDYLKIFDGWKFNILTWIKTNNPPMTNNVFLPDIEYLLYFHNGKRTWNNGLKPIDVYRKAFFSSRTEGHAEIGDVHPTMKPIKLIYDKLRIATNQDDIVLDLFGGSGSTMIACEQLGRKCYMCEIDPRYVDVIINRWEKFTGKQAQLINE